MIIIDLIYNLSLLLALSILSGFASKLNKYRWQGPTLQGIIFGVAVVIGMLNPLNIVP